jgi:RNA polymerase sigma factor (sigma-70 family)
MDQGSSMAKPGRPSVPAMTDDQISGMVRAAAAGDRQAWEGVVDRYVALLWSIALRHGLCESDAADVVQTTWLRLLERIHTVREPSRIGSWLATTAQRESLRCISHRNRVVPDGGSETFEAQDLLQPEADEQLIQRELAVAARHALDALPPTWRSLVEALTADEPASYEEIGADLGVPVGSIGPTRGRAMRMMRELVGD